MVTTLTHSLGTSWSLRQCRGRFLPLYDEDIAKMYAQLDGAMQWPTARGDKVSFT